MNAPEQGTAPADQSPIAEDIDVGTDAPEAESGQSLDDAIDAAFEGLDDDLNPIEPADDAAPGPERGADGRFKAKDSADEAASDGDDDTGDTDPEATEPDEAADETLNDAPSRFSADARAAWKDAPAAVRGEIQRAIREMESGLAQKDEALAPLKPYIEHAAQTGTTLDAALANYVAAEQLLRQDVFAGLDRVARNCGTTLQDVAQAMTGGQQQGGQQFAAMQQQNATLQTEIHNLKQQLAGVSNTIEQQQVQTVEKQVQDFAAQQPRWGELEGEVLRLLQTGYATTLEEAYGVAERLNPAPKVPTPEPQPAPAQTRPARSITGAPSGGSSPTRKRAPATLDESIDAALNFAKL